MPDVTKLLDREAWATVSKSARREVDLRTSATRADRALARVCKSDKPLLAGPFFSEIGFETLYWIPMLNWARERYGLDPARVIAMSRGGPRSWYRDLAHGYLDVFDYASQDEMKEWHVERVKDTRTQKQFDVSEFDQELIRRASKDLPPEFELLHPSLMYRLFRPFWSRIRSSRLVTGHTTFKPFPPQLESEAAQKALKQLPDDFVALKLYYSGTLPDNEPNNAFVRDLINRLTRTTNVVLLSTPVDVDDHGDFDGGGDVIRIDEFMTPRDNLEVQTAVLRRARALFTTYGGFAHLGPFLGVPTFAIYSRLKLNPAHLDVMQRSLQKLKQREKDVGGFILLHVDDMHLLELAIGVELEPRAG